MKQRRHRLGRTAGHRAAVIAALALSGLAIPASALAQPAAGSDGTALERSALVGVWQGLDSEGGGLYWILADAADQPGHLALSGVEDGRDVQSTLRFRSTSATMGYLFGSTARQRLVVRRYVDGGIRVTWPGGREAYLVRVSADPPAPRTPALPARAEFSDRVQAALLRFEGTWRVTAGGEVGALVELVAVDPPAGQLRWTASLDGRGRPLEEPLDLALVRSEPEGWLFWAGEVEYVVSPGDATLQVVVDGDAGLSLQAVR